MHPSHSVGHASLRYELSREHIAARGRSEDPPEAEEKEDEHEESDPPTPEVSLRRLVRRGERSLHSTRLLSDHETTALIGRRRHHRPLQTLLSRATRHVTTPPASNKASAPRGGLAILGSAVVSASFPVLGGACFVVGSCFFWPTVYSINWAGNLAASMFTVGSSFYVVAPVLDYMDMYYGIDLVKPPSSTAKGTEQLEWLYVTNGAWLYLTGCFIVFLGAMLSTFTSLELKKTSLSHTFARRWWTLYWLSDEDSQIVSCCLYMVANTGKFAVWLAL
ncbi:MAG: hypothetical protein SGPRY_000664 [Prymnesium sp.]